MLNTIALAPSASRSRAVSLETSALTFFTRGHVPSQLSWRLLGEATVLGVSAGPPSQEGGHSPSALVPELRGGKN